MSLRKSQRLCGSDLVRQLGEVLKVLKFLSHCASVTFRISYQNWKKVVEEKFGCGCVLVCPHTLWFSVSYRKKAAGGGEGGELSRADGWPVAHRFSCSQELTILSSSLWVSRDPHTHKQTHTHRHTQLGRLWWQGMVYVTLGLSSLWWRGDNTSAPWPSVLLLTIVFTSRARQLRMKKTAPRLVGQTCCCWGMSHTEKNVERRYSHKITYMFICIGSVLF